MKNKKRNYPLWTELPYAGECRPPTDPVEPFAGQWRTYYIRKDKDNGFKTLDGCPIKLAVQNPNTIDWCEQLRIVHRVLDNLTERQIIIAKYWGAGPPSMQWIPIVEGLISTYGVEAPRAARILAAFYAGLNDALVATWYVKYKWLVARPNQFDAELATVICTPRHPSYTSGHGAVAGAAEVILSYFFPAESKRIHELAEEDAMSRLYAGIHFPADNEQGLRLGRQIGKIVVNELKKDRSTQGPVDVPYREFRNADLTPPYEQAFRSDSDQMCESLVMDTSC
ncbi:chloroperoxidase [Bacillus sp. V3-13]|uniref:vanadium-dependent haloperoxidase n=1 Tax=Bacillus sp. V3-13 TaxID=2053728 RepID=UPI000C792972|nr:vanadium-dependent haloperoxidase [Bacillus sp. V3-13]PLR78516.1 chloroperoxidase [Bacillus sp. V3-13]